MTLSLFVLAMIFFLLNTMVSLHPLMLALKVLFLAFSLCLTIGFITTWYAYMIFMIILGGVLVMFTYISSLAPNSIYSLKLDIFIILPQMIVTLILGHNFILFMPKTLNSQKSAITPDNLITFFLSTSTSSLLLLMTLALLLSMVIITELLSDSKSAMRPTMYKHT